MQAEVLSVGTELLLGQTVNTDTTIVAKALSALGIDLLYAAVVGDNVGRLEKAVYDALDRSDILITTGGLGPTGDDLTKETVAAAAGKKLVLHEQSYQHLLDYFANGGMTENQMKQAMLPEGCTALKNDNGTAPGCAFRTDKGKIVIMLPGPPSELTPMLHNYAVPYLEEFQSAVIASHSVHVYGRGGAGGTDDRRPDGAEQPDRGTVCQGRRDVRARDGEGRNERRSGRDVRAGGGRIEEAHRQLRVRCGRGDAGGACGQ